MSTHSLRRIPAVTLVVAGAACICSCASGSGGAASTSAASAAGAPGSPAAPARAPRRDRSVISGDDLRATQASTLYDAVQRYHPEWLVARTGGGGSSTGLSSGNTEVQVFIDAQHAGGLDVLRQFAPSQAASLKFYTGSEAESRWGTGYLNGVIQIVTAAKR